MRFTGHQDNAPSGVSMTAEELRQKEIELLAKYSDEALHDYILQLSFHISTGGELLKDDVDADVDELRLHRRICEEELQRRESE